jgi:hypothetical protein
MSDSADSSQSGMDTQSTQKKGRGCTRMKKLQLMAAREQKQVIDFNSDGHPVGEHAKDFKYHVASLARESVSILKEDWDNVSDDDRAQIWKGLKVILIVSAVCCSLFWGFAAVCSPQVSSYHLHVLL